MLDATFVARLFLQRWMDIRFCKVYVRIAYTVECVQVQCTLGKAMVSACKYCLNSHVHTMVLNLASSKNQLTAETGFTQSFPHALTRFFLN